MINLNTNQPKSNSHPFIATAIGAGVGMSLRHVLPTKEEAKVIKQGVDSFLSSEAMTKRSSNRTIAKFAVVGALVAGTLSLANKFLQNKEEKKTKTDTFEYSKYDAIIEAPESVTELLIYKA